MARINKQGGANHFTVQESQNVSLGQVGSILVDTNTAATPPTGYVFIAITFLTQVTFDSSGGLISVDNNRFINTEAASLGGAGGTGGLQVDVSNAFPKGLTIYGRWKEIDLNSAGVIMAYIGK